MLSAIVAENTSTHRHPRWVWHYGMRRHQLSHVLTTFDNVVSKNLENDATFKILINHLGMKLSSFSYFQGPVQPAVQQWFQRNQKVRFHPRVDVNARRNSFFTLHKKLRSSTMSEQKKDEKLGRALSLELNNQSMTSLPKQADRFLAVDLGSKTKKAIAHLPGDIISVMETINYRASHRVVQLYSKKPAHALRPSLVELQYLIAVMRDTLRDPSELRSDRRFRNEHLNYFSAFHHVAPVLILVVYPGAKARIICGYNDYETLHIQYSDLKQFTEDTFFTEMKELLAWTTPRCQWDTTQPPQMMMFDESEEDEWEAEQSDNNSDETDSEEIPEKKDSRTRRTDMLRAVRTTMRRERRRRRKNLKIQRDKKV